MRPFHHAALPLFAGLLLGSCSHLDDLEDPEADSPSPNGLPTSDGGDSGRWDGGDGGDAARDTGPVVPPPPPPRPIPDGGIDACVSNCGAPVIPDPVPRDAGQRFTYYSALGIVQDNASGGRQWQAVLASQTAAGCSSSFTGFTAAACTWSEADDYCDGLVLGGYSDWELPAASELAMLVDSTRVTPPYINVSYFPSTPLAAFWTSTYESGATSSSAVSFHNRLTSTYADSTYLGVRCAR